LRGGRCGEGWNNKGWRSGRGLDDIPTPDIFCTRHARILMLAATIAIAPRPRRHVNAVRTRARRKLAVSGRGSTADANFDTAPKTAKRQLRDHITQG